MNYLLGVSRSRQTGQKRQCNSRKTSLTITSHNFAPVKVGKVVALWFPAME